MYGRGHLRNSDPRRQKHHGTPMFQTSAAERIAKWEAKLAAEKAAKKASKEPWIASRAGLSVREHGCPA